MADGDLVYSTGGALAYGAGGALVYSVTAPPATDHTFTADDGVSFNFGTATANRADPIYTFADIGDVCPAGRNNMFAGSISAFSSSSEPGCSSIWQQSGGSGDRDLDGSVFMKIAAYAVPAAIQGRDVDTVSVNLRSPTPGDWILGGTLVATTLYVTSALSKAAVQAMAVSTVTGSWSSAAVPAASGQSGDLALSSAVTLSSYFFLTLALPTIWLPSSVEWTNPAYGRNVADLVNGANMVIGLV